MYLLTSLQACCKHDRRWDKAHNVNVREIMTPTFWSHLAWCYADVKCEHTSTYSQLWCRTLRHLCSVTLSSSSRYRIEGTTLEEDGDILLSHHHKHEELIRCSRSYLLPTLIFAIQQKQMYWWRHHEKTGLQVGDVAKMVVNTYRPNTFNEDRHNHNNNAHVGGL